MKKYQAVHITGTGDRSPGAHMEEALAVARRQSRKEKHRYAVVMDGTDNLVAVVWPDGGVDYQTPPYLTKLR